MKIIEITQKLRIVLADYVLSKEYKNGGTLSKFSVNVIEICIALSEILVYREREIKESEYYWFEGSYYLNFEFVGSPFQNIYDLYVELSQIILDGKYTKPPNE